MSSSQSSPLTLAIRPASPHQRSESASAVEEPTNNIQNGTDSNIPVVATFPRRTPSPALKKSETDPHLQDSTSHLTWETLGGTHSTKTRRESIGSIKSFTTSMISPLQRQPGMTRSTSRSRSRSPLKGVRMHEERSRFFQPDVSSDFQPIPRQSSHHPPTPKSENSTLRSIFIPVDDDQDLRVSDKRFSTLPVLAPFKNEGLPFLENFYGEFIAPDGSHEPIPHTPSPQPHVAKANSLDSVGVEKIKQLKLESNIKIPEAKPVVDIPKPSTEITLSSPKQPPHLTSYSTLEHHQKSEESSQADNTTFPISRSRHQPLQLPAEETKIAVIMVGLPARGKSYISRKLTRYMAWIGWKSRVFNVGSYRRKVFGSHLDASFFDPNNTNALAARQEAARLCLEDMIEWFQEGGCVGIFDATNSNRQRRQWVSNVLASAGISTLFVESVCNNEDRIRLNVQEVKVSGPDYQGVDAAQAAFDFMSRIKHYEKSYETLIVEEALSFVKVIDLGDQVHFNRVRGFLPTKVASFVMNLNVTPRTIYFTRHGESQYNLQGKIGGNSSLSAHGEQYAKKLPEVIAQILPQGEKLVVWTSTLNRTIETAQYLPYPKIAWKCLDEIDAGDCDGMTYEQIEENFPEEFGERDSDKFHFRYRNGESYSDLCRRLEPCLMELERHSESEAILVICHQAVLRCLYAYLTGVPPEQLPYIKVPLHTLIALSPRAYGTHEERWQINVPAVDTHIYHSEMSQGDKTTW